MSPYIVGVQSYTFNPDWQIQYQRPLFTSDQHTVAYVNNTYWRNGMSSRLVF
jgi:hypothetical protein